MIIYGEIWIFKKEFARQGAEYRQGQRSKRFFGKNICKKYEDDFKKDLQAATDSKHATDKILAMMKLCSMISKKSEFL